MYYVPFWARDHASFQEYNGEEDRPIKLSQLYFYGDTALQGPGTHLMWTQPWLHLLLVFPWACYLTLL